MGESSSSMMGDICGFDAHVRQKNDTKLHSDLVWANSLQWDGVSCSAATQLPPLHALVYRRLYVGAVPEGGGRDSGRRTLFSFPFFSSLTRWFLCDVIGRLPSDCQAASS